jgi:hypothetical protein
MRCCVRIIRERSERSGAPHPHTARVNTKWMLFGMCRFCFAVNWVTLA